MELCEKTLENFIDYIKICLEEKLFLSPVFYFIVSQLFIEIIEGVNYLHTQSPPLIHRDLKPVNILLKRDKRGNLVKIADFGLLAIHKFVEESHTADKGTVKYMAPEVI
jgi:serine/threonine protein kinase